MIFYTRTFYAESGRHIQKTFSFSFFVNVHVTPRGKIYFLSLSRIILSLYLFLIFIFPSNVFLIFHRHIVF
jgi:hypothetical protein